MDFRYVVRICHINIALKKSLLTGFIIAPPTWRSSLHLSLFRIAPGSITEFTGFKKSGYEKMKPLRIALKLCLFNPLLSWPGTNVIKCAVINKARTDLFNGEAVNSYVKEHPSSVPSVIILATSHQSHVMNVPHGF
jgi:hypothetical protein